MTGLPDNAVWFNEPVAIEFFELASNRELYDSLSASGSTDDFYALMDQVGLYRTLAVPVLDSMRIKRIDSIPEAIFVIFGDSTSNYIVSIEKLKSEDGVLMFTPGKKPVYWQERNLNRNCTEETFVKCYFGK